MRDTLILHGLYNNNLIDLNAIKSYKKLYRKELHNAKKNVNDKYISTANNKQRAMWEIINSNQNQNKINNTLVTAEEFNNYFSYVASYVSKDSVNTSSTDCEKNLMCVSNNYFSFEQVSFDEVREIIYNLNNPKDEDIYAINNQILKTLVNIIIIICILNQFPDILKDSKVVTIHKKGDINNPNNYRPISLVPTLGKVTEILLKRQLNGHFEKNNIFTLINLDLEVICQPL